MGLSQCLSLWVILRTYDHEICSVIIIPYEGFGTVLYGPEYGS